MHQLCPPFASAQRARLAEVPSPETAESQPGAHRYRTRSFLVVGSIPESSSLSLCGRSVLTCCLCCPQALRRGTDMTLKYS